MERFWSLVKKGGPVECWEWLSGKDKDGYGKISIAYFCWKSHRAAYFIEYGGVPNKEKFVCHSCDNPSCCNPAHLFLGTAADNSADMISKNRHRSPRGERHPAAKLTADNVIEIRRRIGCGESQMVVAAEFQVDQSSISHVATQKTWRCLNG